MPQHQYLGQTADVAAYLDSVSNATPGDAGTSLLDSVKNQSGFALPKHLASSIEHLPDDQASRVLDSVRIGCAEFKSRHGVDVSADVVEAAIQQGYAATKPLKSNGNSIVLDSAANSNHSDNGALQANRTITAIVSAISEAIPFAGYLPVDIKSNKAQLAILNHVADSTWGDYAKGSLMDGVSCGGSYAMSVRTVMLKAAGGTLATSSKFTAENLVSLPGFCDPTKTGVPVLKGRSMLYANGIPVAFEPASSPGTMTGQITLAGVTYTLAAQINSTTAVLSSVTCNPAPTADMVITAEAVVDYEAAPGLAPRVIVEVKTYEMLATAMRIMTGSTIDFSTQLANELGLDARSESLMAVRTQVEAERHYNALRYVAALGRNLSREFNFDVATQKGAKSLDMMWRDAAPIFSVIDQEMAEATMDHGVTHYYVGKNLAALLQSAPGDVFQTSGISGRAGIYRVGRLWGKYEIYYSPKVVEEAADGSWSEMIGVGRSSQPARCPIILGDAVAPTFMPIAMTGDFSQNDGLYARNFTSVNPHVPSALGCARLKLTGLK